MGSNYLKGRAGDKHPALWAGKGCNLMLPLSAWVGNLLAVMLWAFSHSSRAENCAFLKTIQATEVSCCDSTNYKICVWEDPIT
jgi:hypothetical protein